MTTACWDCSICLETATEPVVMLCGHLYCSTCIFCWLTTSSDGKILVKAQTFRQGSTHLGISLAPSISDFLCPSMNQTYVSQESPLLSPSQSGSTNRTATRS
ncbi:hypothetical protein ZWY2020_044482 [Hordeum vulgare]|nr:hypothetical protein ZWY2020_044482 [Hordeum vulgare]